MSNAPASWGTPGPIRGVIFDLHSTLVDQGSAEEWLDLSLARNPHPLDDAERAELVAFLDRIWENARVHDPDSARDLSAEAHRDVFHRLLDEGPGVDASLGDALYASLLDTWHAYDDTAVVLADLQSAGIRIAVLSNVGVPVQHVLDREGISPYADVTVLSWQVGTVKPEPQIFERALTELGLHADEVLMVGDSGKDDVGAAHIGIRTLILPRTAGRLHGLAAVTALVRGVNEGYRDVR
jgi:HAD superfamily hydrolase (TIGR01493 family)